MTATATAPATAARLPTIASVADIAERLAGRAAGDAVIRYDDGTDYRVVDAAAYVRNIRRGVALLGASDDQARVSGPQVVRELEQCADCRFDVAVRPEPMRHGAAGPIGL